MSPPLKATVAECFFFQLVKSSVIMGFIADESSFVNHVLCHQLYVDT